MKLPTNLPRFLFAGTIGLLATCGIDSLHAQNGPIVSIDFAKDLVMGSDEKAGVVEASHWNVETSQSGSASDLEDSNGKKTAIKVKWEGGRENYSNGEIEDQPGNARMMKEYLDCETDHPTKVNLAGMGSTFSGQPYDVLVYFDEQNGPASRVSEFQIDDQIICGKDAGRNSFQGDFEESSNAPTSEEAQPGNYVRFYKLTKDSIELEVRAGLSQDPYPRGFVCGIQLVPSEK